MAEWKIETDTTPTVILYIGPYEPGIIGRLIGLIEEDEEYGHTVDEAALKAALDEEIEHGLRPTGGKHG